MKKERAEHKTNKTMELREDSGKWDEQEKLEGKKRTTNRESKMEGV